MNKMSCILFFLKFYIISYIFDYPLVKSTSRHIFEKVLICIGRGLCYMEIKEMDTFEHFNF